MSEFNHRVPYVFLDSVETPNHTLANVREAGEEDF